MVLAIVASIASAGGSRQTTAAPGGPMPFTWVTWQIYPITAEHPFVVEYLNETFNVDLQVWNVDSADYNTQLNLLLATGQVPDFFRSFLDQIDTYYNQGIIAPYAEETFRNSAPRAYRSFTETISGFLNYHKKDGRLFAIPRGVNAPNGNPNPVVINSLWMKNVGKTNTPRTLNVQDESTYVYTSDIPRTLDQLEELVYLFANNDPNRSGRKDTYGISTSAMSLVYGAFGFQRGQWNLVNGSLAYSSIQPEMKDALTVLARWYRDGVIDPEFVTGENKGGNGQISHAFIEGRIGITTHAQWWAMDYGFRGNEALNYLQMAEINREAANSMVYGLPVTGPTGKAGLPRQNAINNEVGYFGKQVERQPEKMTKYFEMMEWLNLSLDNFYTVTYGKKGETWDYVNGVPTLFPDFIDFRYVASHGGHNQFQRMQTPEFTTLTPQRFNVYMTTVGLNTHTSGSFPYESLLILPTPSTSNYKTELDRLENMAYIDIITGARPISYFDQFVTEWRRIGGDILTREANEWYNSNR